MMDNELKAQAPAGQPEAEGEGEAEAIEAALWAGAELMGNVSDSGYEDAVKAKVTFANYRSRAIAMQQEFNAVRLEYASELQFELETFDKIWSAVTGDKIGQWDYPAQVVRHVEHMRDDNATLRAQLAASLEREARLREALEKVKGVSDSYSGADIPHIANPKRALYEAESVFNEIAQALADAGEIAAEALASNGGERG